MIDEPYVHLLMRLPTYEVTYNPKDIAVGIATLARRSGS